MKQNKKQAPSENPAVQVRPAWRWHYRILSELRDRLLNRRDQQLEEVAQPLEPHSLSDSDSATDEFDRDLALSRLSAEQDALYEVDEAIRRIMDGTYGICQDTGKSIPTERLQAVPWTRFSRESEERLEKNGDVQRSGLGKVASVRKRVTRTIKDAEIPGQEPDEIPLHGGGKRGGG